MSESTTLADLVLGVHALIGVAVFGGLAVAIAGQILHWRWTRANAWRVPHLVVTVFLFLRSNYGVPCPFSVWEDSLRPVSAGMLPPTNPVHETLRFLAFRNLDAQPFNRAMAIFALATAALFLAQQIKARQTSRPSR